MTDLALKALEAFVLDNADLETLEGLLGKFNIFEAIGAVRQELRHSDFLAYLLDPHQNHGLGDAFIKKLLQKALLLISDIPVPITLIDLDTWDLEEMEVLREWRSIDILLKDARHQLVVAIENKVDAQEHSGQLQRYRQTLTQHFPGWKVLGLFLTPDGAIPSDDLFIPIDYGSVASLIDRLAEARASTLGHDARTLMIRYTETLRRHIVDESDVARLCQRIYRKHKQAIDLIIEHRPDLQATIREYLESLIRRSERFVLDESTKTAIRFVPKHWDDLNLQVGEWTSTGKILLFEFQNRTDSLKLKLLIGPGDREVREALFLMAQRNRPFLHTTTRVLGQKWNEIFSREFVSPKSYAQGAEEDFNAEIEERWNQFLKSDFPQINNLVVNEKAIQRVP
jgi:thiamine phosphate synthase YjbQ (UPF0047 family)